jgi:polyisoprenyl-teichoic acid--peptidoglycan teichoic acid transferase
MMSMKRAAMGLVMLALTACGAIPGSIGASAGPGLQAASLGATSTPTPFEPQAPTATPAITDTPLPTATPTQDPSKPWGSFPAPVEPSAIEVPPPAPLIDFAPNVVNLLVMGSDERPYESVGRSDVFMVASLDPNKGTLTLISFPRDLYVYIPGWRVDRINTAVVRGGPELAEQTVLYNYGIPIQHWVQLNFTGFMTIVNTLGGVDVQVTGYLYDECGRRYWRYAPGNYHMDGFTALCYVRMRKASSDFDRLRREQEVAQALVAKVFSLNGLQRVPELYNQFKSYARTDVSVDDVLPLLPLGAQLAADPSRLHHYTVDTSMATSWIVPYSGASVQLPNRDKIQEMLNQAFGNGQ